MATMQATNPVQLNMVDGKEHPIQGTQEYPDTKETSVNSSERNSLSETIEYQYGVRKARGITKAWNKKSMWLIFFLLWVLSFADMLMVTVNGTLAPYMTSRFQRHGLVATTSIVSSIASGTSALTFAKLADVAGRVETLTFTLALQLVAQIMKAGSQNIETYVAGDIFYWVAHIGMIGMIDLIIADSTSLKNRVIVFGINYTPTIVSVFAGPEIANHFLNINIRWGFGAFTIILTAVAIAPIALLYHYERKAFALGYIEKKESTRNVLQTISHYFWEFDIIGIFLLTAAFAILLLPFSLVTYAPDGWKTDYIIAMIVLGAILFPAFVAWERYFTPVPFLKWKYCRDRTIIGSSVLYGVMFASTFVWNGYFRSYLQVVHRLSVVTADYTLNTYSLSSAFIMPFVGWIIATTGRYKWVAYGGFPILILGTALLIPFRTPDTGVGILVMTQLFVGLGAGVWVGCGFLAITIPVTQQEIAAVLAIWGLFGSIGASIGFAIAGALWNNVLPQELAKRWPAGSETDWASAFADLTVQLSYADGTPERAAIVGAYGYVQRIMVIVGVSLMPLCLLAIFIWRDVDVKKVEKEKGEQTTGTVF